MKIYHDVSTGTRVNVSLHILMSLGVNQTTAVSRAVLNAGLTLVSVKGTYAYTALLYPFRVSVNAKAAFGMRGKNKDGKNCPYAEQDNPGRYNCHIASDFTRQQG